MCACLNWSKKGSNPTNLHILSIRLEGGCDVSDIRMSDSHDDLLTPLWDPDADDRCIVCSRPSNGKAVCSDVRCAEELARG